MKLKMIDTLKSLAFDISKSAGNIDDENSSIRPCLI